MKHSFVQMVVTVLIASIFVSCEKSSFVGLDENMYSDTYIAFAPESTSSNPELENTLPDEWGCIKGLSVTAVPADDERNRSFDKKCLIIRTDLGAVTVVFAREKAIPDVEDIANGTFTEGNFDESYNSGFFTQGNWVPAQAVDSKDRIEYLIDGVCRRNLRYTTLKTWDWQNKDDYYTTKVYGYDFDVKDGILTIMYDGEQVMQIR